jgi:hypothetical protein
MGGLKVLGERCDELSVEMVGLEFTFLPGDLARVHGRVPPQGAVMRAIHRAEAELLVADAKAMGEGVYSHRTAEHRRAAAFTLVLLRFVDAMKERDRAVDAARIVRHGPARKRKRRSHRHRR